MDWKKVKLNELVTKLGDGIHGTPKYSENVEYYFVNGNNIKNGQIIFNKKTKRVSQKEYLKHKKDLNSETMFVSINGSIGKVGFYNFEKIMLGKSICYFNVKEDLVNKRFLYYVINSNYFLRYAKSQATGSTIKNVSLKSMRNFPIPLPPLATQKKIAAILDAADAYRQKTKALIGKYEQLGQSLFLEMFGDPVVNPKGYELTTIRNIVSEVKYGTSSKASAKGKYPYLRMNNITYQGHMD